MNLQDFASLAEIVGGFAVLATLIYLVIELRNNTKTTRAQMHDNVTSGYLSVCAMVVDNAKAFSAGIAASQEEFDSFSDEDKVVYFGTIFGFFKHFEHIYSQHRRGYIDESDWAAWSEHILLYFHQPGVQLWWSLRRGSFVQHFGEFLESSLPPAAETMVGVMRKK